MSFESGDPRTQPRLLDNPVAIRALAHPVRLALIGLVGREGPTTSAEAARELGISQALASHHMRQLAKYGFLEPAAEHNGRDRPWQVTAVATSWRGAGGDPQSAEAAVDIAGNNNTVFSNELLAADIGILLEPGAMGNNHFGNQFFAILKEISNLETPAAPAMLSSNSVALKSATVPGTGVKGTQRVSPSR